MFRLLTRQHTVWPRSVRTRILSLVRHLSRLEFRPSLLYLPSTVQDLQKQELAMGKRKSSSALAPGPAITTVPIPVPWDESVTRPAKRRKGERGTSKTHPGSHLTNPDRNADVLDGREALRASPDADEQDESMDAVKAGMDVEEQVKKEDDKIPSLVTGSDSESALSDLSDTQSPVQATPVKLKPKKAVNQKVALKKAALAPKQDTKGEPQFLDPEAEGEEEADEEEIQAALSRPPLINSDYLPLPWKGRLGYVGFEDRVLRSR